MNHVRRRVQTFSIALLIAVASFATFLPSHANAELISSDTLNSSTDCDITQATTFSGTITTVPNDQYDVYVRLPTEGQTANVNIYGQIQDGTSSCEQIGTNSNVSGNEWTLVGQWDSTSDNDSTNDDVFELASDDLDDLLGANRPSVMLISQTNPVCQPTTECTVTIDDQEGFVRPIGTLPNQDSLHIVRPIDPSQDSVKQVVYYVDNEPVYTTKTLQPFDTRYVAHASQLQSRVIEYTSGQRVVLNQTTPNDFGSSFSNFLFREVHANPKLLITIAIIILLGILWAIALAIIHTVRRHKAWRIAHGLEQERITLLTDADRRREFLDEHRRHIIARVVEGFVGVVAILALIVVINTYIIQLYRVDGHSMETTYKNNSHVFINKVPVTLAHLAGHDYTPQRGQVVIVREVFGVTDDVQAGVSNNLFLIKRVIGLPGDRITLSDGVLTVYNTDHPDGFNPDQNAKWSATMVADDGSKDLDVTLGSDELFIAGDNRPVSVDSRFNGPILTKQIVGLVD